MSTDYAIEKYKLAVYGLAVSDGPLSQRLQSAVISIMNVKNDDLPSDELQEQHQKIWEMLTADKSDPHEGSARTTTTNLSADDAMKAAKMIYELTFGLIAHVQNN